MPKDIVTHPVNSSNIKALGHDPKSNTLRVEFYGAKQTVNVYDYTPVTEEAYKEMVLSESIGKYFHANIRTNEAVQFKKVKSY